jgi:hypothetical protein
MVRPSGTEAPGARRCGQADLYHEPRARVSSWPPLRLARLRRERESVGVVSPTAPVTRERRREMRRVIGIDIHRTFGEVVIWEDDRLRSFGRVDMTRTALEGLGGKLLPTDEVVIEATGNCMAVSRVLSPFVRRVVIANPLQVKAIAHARVKTDKVDAGTLASLFAAGYLPEILTPRLCNRTKAPADRAQVSACPSSHADQERSACDPARAPYSEVSSLRSIQSTGTDMAGAPGAAGGRTRCDRSACAGT